jgi:hypothetical protein
MPITRRRRSNPPDQPENNNHLSDQPENTPEELSTEQPSSTEINTEPVSTPVIVRQENAPFQPLVSPQPSPPVVTNGERSERQEYTPVPPIEGGRRTARGELFRRPPQPPATQTVAASVNSAYLQPPTHEIFLPLGKKPGDTTGDPLHLSYNPGYTGSDEVRSTLLNQLAMESKAGGRARCWNCGSIAIVYDRWQTRSKTFGEIGIAMCEICGVWSVM